VKGRAVLGLALALGLVAAAAITWLALTGSETPRPTADAHGPLSAAEYSLATQVAKDRQAEITGTFIGATAAIDPDRPCELQVRLVWKADANFMHGGVPGAPPDGPRKALLISVNPQTGHTCRTGASYRNVGAAAGETLLYGRRP
jgi:hypothetical protein